MYTIITIARQKGAGGSKIAHLLAQRLEVNCYDGNLVTLAAEKSGLNESALRDADEKASSSLLYSFVMSAQPHHSGIDRLNVPINDQLFAVQSEIIRELAGKESCIIVGHCADHILAEHPNTVRVFLHGSPEIRTKRLADEQNIPESSARDTMLKTDKRRANYYNYYSGDKWGHPENYDLCLSTDKLTPEEAAEIIANYVKTRQSK